MKLRVLIVDDEALSRERMRRFLRGEPGTEVVGECTTGIEAVGAIRQHSPDIVFLDVTMPELDGFGVLKELNGGPQPAIIFVTAHDQFALRAFEIHAVDYLLKPFDRSRFRTALGRARDRLHRGGGPAGSKVPSPQTAGSNATNLNRLECIAVKSSGRIKVVRPAEVDWIGAADNYAELHVGPSSHLLRMTLSSLSERLPPEQFARISRSALVNLERITEMRPKSHGDYVIVLRDGTCLQGSRNYRQMLAGLLGQARGKT